MRNRMPFQQCLGRLFLFERNLKNFVDKASIKEYTLKRKTYDLESERIMNKKEKVILGMSYKKEDIEVASNIWGDREI